MKVRDILGIRQATKLPASFYILQLRNFITLRLFHTFICLRVVVPGPRTHFLLIKYRKYEYENETFASFF